MSKTWLCYYEIHVDDRTFYEHVLVETDDNPLNYLHSEVGDHYHRQAKGCLGEFTPSLAKKYMREQFNDSTWRCPECGEDADGCYCAEDAEPVGTVALTASTGRE